ncbi:hypothetical protein [Streptomyces yunnanensis]|uniref:Uncharacterized protein n=1 Tax=Streptomyces yunnanensis TaxID=156453 RepID=A0A9X8QS77_9ACTN|nr:hypothetical protein [Streptomyces yunnanensis]SHL73647.1 hypothetical protein SAMN05216268_10622 [Streptomyces yunnanensis]
MTTYLLHLHIPGHDTRPLTITGGTPGELAAAVHRHARGQLGSSRVDVHLDGLDGEIVAHGATAGTFTLQPVEQTQPATSDSTAADHVAHGYTMRDLDRAARAACTADRTLSSNISLRYDLAWSAIAEHLVTTDQPPAWPELVRVGWQAIYQDVKAVRRLYGVDSTGRSGEVASAPRFVAYWTHASTDGASDGIVERIAVHQVLATLPEHQRQAVVALATQDDYQKAADALGIKYATLTARIRHGRRGFRTLWFSPETAPPTKGTDRRVASRAGTPNHCPQGHEYTPENTIRRPSSRGRRCRTCEQIRDAARNRRRAEVA